MILSFDTSNYTTSSCLLDTHRGIIWQNRILLHPSKGQRGLRQSDVVFLHTQNMMHLLDGFPQAEITAIAASEKPCPKENSYMPCFLVGKHYAAALANVLQCPCHYYSHQENHIFAGLYSSGNMKLLENDFLVFHVSGGTTDILYVHPKTDGLAVDRIGGSLDLHAGQLIDRIGVTLGLEFPCGKEMERLALAAKNEIAVKPCVNEFDFNLSGFENQAKMLLNQQPASEIAKFTFACVARTLDRTILNLRKSFKNIPILFVGGVMSNHYIAEYLLNRHEKLYFSDAEYSSDHALGNAVMCAYYMEI